jgi:hypothetical protein
MNRQERRFITREPAGHQVMLVAKTETQCHCLTRDVMTRHQRRSFPREPAGHKYLRGSLIKKLKLNVIA